MTLDEYKALKQKERAKVNYQERHIEGDEVQWKNTAVLKKEEDEFFSGTRVSESKHNFQLPVYIK